MRSTSQAHADAHESVTIADATDLKLSTLAIDGITALYVHGNPAQRADFLRRLSAAAGKAADELVPRIQTEGTPRLVMQP